MAHSSLGVGSCGVKPRDEMTEFSDARRDADAVGCRDLMMNDKGNEG